MLMLCGGAVVLQQSLKCGVVGAAPVWLMQQFNHAEWGGDFTCWDLVMPLFIFITGASMPFAFAGYREKGGAGWRIGAAWRVLRRVVLLFLLGMLVQGHLASARVEQMHFFCNTLQAIAAGYLIASVVYMFGGLRAQIVTALFCMGSYWALLRFMPYNGQPGGLFLPDNNLAIYLDHMLLGAWQDGTPYSWILTSLSFGALTLMGGICGSVIREHQGMRTSGKLALAGSICLLVACVLELDTPLIKHIYTTTAVLWSGGWCILLLALFHLLFDCSGRFMEYLAFPLRVMGCNALLAYLLTEVHGPHGHSMWWGVSYPLFHGISAQCGDAAVLVYSMLSLGLLWLFLCALYGHRVFLRV